MIFAHLLRLNQGTETDPKAEIIPTPEFAIAAEMKIKSPDALIVTSLGEYPVIALWSLDFQNFRYLIIHEKFLDLLDTETLNFVMAHECAHGILKNTIGDQVNAEEICDLIVAKITGKETAFKALAALETYNAKMNLESADLPQRLASLRENKI